MPCFRPVLCCALLACGCACQPSTVPDPPNDDLANQSIQQSAASNQRISHLTRLRDIDRLRHAEEVADLTSRIDTLRGLCVALTFLMAACCLWLAIEIRRRRILSTAIHHIAHETPSLNPHTVSE